MSEDKKSSISKSSNPASHENLTKAKFEDGLSSRSKRLIRDERRIGSKSDALASAITKKPGISKMGVAVRSDKPSEAKQIAKETLSSISPAAGKSDHNCEYCDRINDWKTYRKSIDLGKSYSKKPHPSDVMDKGIWSDIQTGNPFNFSVTKRTGLQNEPACHIHASDGKHEFMGLFSLLGGKITENILSRQGQFPPQDPRHKLLQKKAREVAAKHLLSKNEVESSALNKAKEYVPQKKVQSFSIQAPTMPKVNTPSVSKPADPNLKIRTPGPLNKSEPSEDLAKGKNKREQRRLVYGNDANGGRLSPNRMKMMQNLKRFLDSRHGVNAVTASGKRTDDGKLKEKKDIYQEPFDVFTPKGHEEEKSRQEKIKEINEAKGKSPDYKPLKAKFDSINGKIKRIVQKHGGSPSDKGVGTKLAGLEEDLKEASKNLPRKRSDPKPDWRSGDFETQPSPDAAVHEMAHFYLQPEGRNLSDMQTEMDKEWGNSQSKYGHMQQKKTKEEIRPMAAENKIRRMLGMPANNSYVVDVKDKNKKITKQNVFPMSEHGRPVEQAVDGSGPRFVRGVVPSGTDKQATEESRQKMRIPFDQEAKNRKTKQEKRLGRKLTQDEEKKALALTPSQVQGLKNVNVPKKMSVDLMRQARLLPPELAEQVDKIDRGEIVAGKGGAWEKGTSPNAKINQRAREASKDNTRKDSKTLMRSEED